MCEVLKMLNENGSKFKAENFQFAENNIDLLAYKQAKAWIILLNEKLLAVSEELRPKDMKELRSYLGAATQLKTFFSELSEKD